ncbi:VanZ family protein [Streptomyces sp. URMC 123]|uniref:VanZ family protein n=1 Tax=Streptomyces sp. URMC 123 TaxID=3423403 RepID=UPI003F19E99E
MQRHGPGDTVAFRIRATGLLLLVGHLLLVGWLTLRPLDVPWVTPANLHPLATIRTELEAGTWESMRELGGGLLLLAPLGVLLPLIGGRPAASGLGSLARTVFAGAMVALLIELLQTDVPGRTLDVDSLLLNTVGVGLAHLAVVPAVRARLRRREQAGARAPLPREDGPQAATPTIPRVRIAP